MARLQQNLSDPQPLKHAASMILPALEHLEVFNDFFMANLGPRFDASVVWGMQYIVIKVIMVEYPREFGRVALLTRRCKACCRTLGFNQTNRGDDQEAWAES